MLGVAIGFGAQNVVQDFLAGIFMMLEDQYGVGDVAEIGKITGTVEAISLRISRVRDVSGVVWHIRNGTITQSGNESHGWARAVVDFPVPYRSDISKVREVMQDAAAAMWHEPGWEKVILERPEVWGVQDLSADAIVMRDDRTDRPDASVGSGARAAGPAEARAGQHRRGAAARSAGGGRPARRAGRTRRS